MSMSPNQAPQQNSRIIIQNIGNNVTLKGKDPICSTSKKFGFEKN